MRTPVDTQFIEVVRSACVMGTLVNHLFTVEGARCGKHPRLDCNLREIAKAWTIRYAYIVTETVRATGPLGTTEAQCIAIPARHDPHATADHPRIPPSLVSHYRARRIFK